MLLLFISANGYSQVNDSDIIGKWIIKDLIDNCLITNCGISKEESDESLKQEYIGASIELSSSQELIYRDKNNQTDKHEFFTQFKWRLSTKNKLELVESSTNQTLKRVTLEYKNDDILFDFIGLILVLVKSD